MPLDADDIARLYAAHARGLVAYFARRTFDPQAAGELMAETFAAAVADRRAFRGHDDDAAGAWLYGIARHQLSGWYRRAAVERKMLGKLGLEPPLLSEVEYERIEELAGLAGLRARVAQLVDALPAESREALRLRILEERPYPEVAAELGIAEPAARARVSRAFDTLISGAAPTDDPGQVERRVLGNRIVFWGRAHPDVVSVTIKTPRDVRTLIPTSDHFVLAVYDGQFPGGKATATARLRDGKEVTRSLYVE